MSQRDINRLPFLTAPAKAREAEEEEKASKRESRKIIRYGRRKVSFSGTSLKLGASPSVCLNFKS